MTTGSDLRSQCSNYGRSLYPDNLDNVCTKGSGCSFWFELVWCTDHDVKMWLRVWAEKSGAVILN